MNGAISAQITGWGMYVPERVVTNSDLAKTVDTDDAWIYSHTGIRQRHIVANERETTLTLALRAAREALVVAGLSPGQLDLIIVATATPEYTFPSTACLLQDALGAGKSGAFDLSAGCSGFVYALSVASDIVRNGSAEHVLVVGAETLSRITDWSDRNTCILFGDGAGAVVLSACRAGPVGVLSSVLGSDGSGGDLLILPGGGSHSPASATTVANGDHFIKMRGGEVYRFATQAIAHATQEVIKKAGWELSQVALIIAHQANARILESAAKRMALPMERFYVNVERYGNTSSASVPIALCEAIEGGRIKSGDRLVMVGFGAGLTWAAAAVEWGVPVPVQRRPWLRRFFASIVFASAAVRSFGLRLVRWGFNVVLGPEGSENWRGKLRHRIDDWKKSRHVAK